MTKFELALYFVIASDMIIYGAKNPSVNDRYTKGYKVQLHKFSVVLFFEKR